LILDANLQKLLIIARVVIEKHVGNVEKWGREWGKCIERGRIR